MFSIIIVVIAITELAYIDGAYLLYYLDLFSDLPGHLVCMALHNLSSINTFSK